MREIENKELGVYMRVIEIDGVEYYMLRDIGNSLGYKRPRSGTIGSCKEIIKHKVKLRSSVRTYYQDVNFIKEEDVHRILRKCVGRDLDVIKYIQSELPSKKECIVVRPEFSFGEDLVSNLFSDYTICSQYPVFGGEYKIDWYIPELNLAVEFDEVGHNTINKRKADAVRQKRIEAELNCRFIRYKDF